MKSLQCMANTQILWDPKLMKTSVEVLPGQGKWVQDWEKVTKNGKKLEQNAACGGDLSKQILRLWFFF